MLGIWLKKPSSDEIGLSTALTRTCLSKTMKPKSGISNSERWRSLTESLSIHALKRYTQGEFVCILSAFCERKRGGICGLYSYSPSMYIMSRRDAGLGFRFNRIYMFKRPIYCLISTWVHSNLKDFYNKILYFMSKLGAWAFTVSVSPEFTIS